METLKSPSRLVSAGDLLECVKRIQLYSLPPPPDVLALGKADPGDVVLVLEVHKETFGSIDSWGWHPGHIVGRVLWKGVEVKCFLHLNSSTLKFWKVLYRASDPPTVE